MKGATESPASGVEFIPEESAYCISCDCRIAGHFISKRVVNIHSLDPTEQIVKAYCGHCGKVYQIKRMLRGGVWEVVGEVTLVTNKNERQKFIERCERLAPMFSTGA